VSAEFDLPLHLGPQGPQASGVAAVVGSTIHIEVCGGVNWMRPTGCGSLTSPRSSRPLPDGGAWVFVPLPRGVDAGVRPDVRRGGLASIPKPRHELGWKSRPRSFVTPCGSLGDGSRALVEGFNIGIEHVHSEVHPLTSQNRTLSAAVRVDRSMIEFLLSQRGRGSDARSASR
jgi:hypothetical protein